MDQDLASLLTSTQQLLSCAEPSLTAWEDYSQRRNELFQRIQNLPTLGADRVAESQARQRLMASVLEQDELLMGKIRHHLSEIRHEMSELADRRRLFNAYVVGAQGPRSYYLQKV